MNSIRKWLVLLLSFMLIGAYAQEEPITEVQEDSTMEATDDTSMDLTEEGEDDLMDMDLGALLDMEVTSVSKKAEPLFKTSSAIYVVSADDIKRKGARSVPEALRGVPGLQIQRVNAMSYKITVRGQQALYNRALLVMVDGRTVYTPTFSGVYWDMVNVADVDRIEVIRGPGATLWGANAVNGIINIITKSAKDTEGGLVEFGTGNQSTETTFRYGFVPQDDLNVRIYGKHGYFYDLETAEGSNKTDQTWETFQTGLKLEWDVTEEDNIRLQGDYFTSETRKFDRRREGSNVVFAYTKTHDEDSSTSFQFFYNGYENTDDDADATAYPPVLDSFTESLNTYDVDLRHQWISGDHSMTIGAGYRNTDGSFTPSRAVNLGFPLGVRSVIDIKSDTYESYNVYFQDKITLVEDKFYVTPGIKVEYNNFTDTEVMPSLRMAYTPDETQTIWAAVTKAVRTPAFFERNSTLVGTTGLFTGNSDVKAEVLISYEVGYRVKPIDTLSLDFTAFLYDYDHASSYASTGLGNAANENKIQTYGFETAAKWIYSEDLTLQATYSLTSTDLDTGTGSSSLTSEDNLPSHMGSLQAYYNITSDLSFNSSFYYTDSIDEDNIAPQTKLDCGFIYQATKQLELSLYATNLLDSSTKESANDFGNTAQEVPRSIFANLAYTF